MLFALRPSPCSCAGWSPSCSWEALPMLATAMSRSWSFATSSQSSGAKSAGRSVQLDHIDDVVAASSRSWSGCT